VVLARRKLHHYFEAHPVTVVSSFPLGEIIRNPDAAGRIAKWSVELMGETLAYAPRKAIKSQILADFVAKWTDTQLPPPQIQAKCWTLYFDGSVMKTGAGAGLLFVSPLGEHMRYTVHLHFPASNNMAEYEALLCGLKVAIELGVKCLDVRGDSQLVIDQVMKNAKALKVVVAPRRPMGKRGPETVRCPVGAVVVVLTGASRREAARSDCRRSDRAWRERWPERRRRRGVDGHTTSAPAGVCAVVVRAVGAGADPAWCRARSSSRLVRRIR
jgi:ribonuclease HI